MSSDWTWWPTVASQSACTSITPTAWCRPAELTPSSRPAGPRRSRDQPEPGWPTTRWHSCFERVDPALEAAGLVGDQFGLSECVCQHRGPLVCGHEFDRQVVRVVSTHCSELALGPLDRDRHESGGGLVGPARAFLELRAESPVGTAILRDQVAPVCQLSGERLQSAVRTAMGAVEPGEHRFDVVHMGLDDGGDDLIFGLEVVVDVP